MKKLIASALCAVMALSLPAAAFAAEPMVISPNPMTAEAEDIAQGPAEKPQSGYTLKIDGEDTGVRACVMVPLRAVGEKLGFTVTWNGDGTILLDDGVMHSTVTIGVPVSGLEAMPEPIWFPTEREQGMNMHM